MSLKVGDFTLTIYEAENRVYAKSDDGYEMSIVGYRPIQAIVQRILELETENTRLVEHLMEASL